MRFGIVEAADHTERGNPGWHMINAGIRYLFRKAFPGVEFVSLRMLSPWRANERELAKTCDVLVLAGNPRYDGGSHAWLYAGVMDQMLETGCRLIDAWQGAGMAVGNDVETDARAILENPRNKAIIERLRKFDAIITRDDRAQRANELAGLSSVQLPCSSWWAAQEYGIKQASGVDKVFIANNVRQIDRAILNHSHWRVVATSRVDFKRCSQIGVKAELVFHPELLLSLFASADTVISCRLHSGIPAASLGCKTSLVAIDTRAQAADAFAIPWAGPAARHGPRRAVAPHDPTETIRALL